MRVVAGLPQTIAQLPELDRMVSMCSSFLTVRESYVYFIHQSAKDYLVTNQSTVIFSAGCERIHYEIYSRSLNAMSNTLRQDICELKDPGPLTMESRPKQTALNSIEYACVHWFDHLCQHNSKVVKNSQELDEKGKLHTFFAEHLLHWLESLGLMREISAIILIIKSLLQSVQVCFSKLAKRIQLTGCQSTPNSEFAKLQQDSMRLVLTYGSTIEQAPLQVYSGALVFCPENSEIKRLFWNNRLPFVRSVTGVQKNWNSCLQVLEGHGNSPVNDVRFSPDGQTLATASTDYTIKLWDATIGIMKQSLEGHKGPINSISFLQDSQSLVSGSEDGTVLLWNTATTGYERMLKSHEGMVSAISFSASLDALVVGLSSGTILLRDPVTSTWNRIFQGTINLSEASDVSLDVKATIDHAWDRVKKGNKAINQFLERKISYDEFETVINDAKRDNPSDFIEKYNASAKHANSNRVDALNISPDGQVLAYAWRNGTVRLWGTASSTWKEIYNNERPAQALAFSPDSLTLALGLYQGSVRIWDMRSRAWKHTIEKEESPSLPMSAVSFSQDGQSLFSTSARKVHRWSLAAKESHEVISTNGPREFINAMAFSEDGRLLTLASYMGRVYIWDTNLIALNPSVDGPDNRSTTVPSSRNQALVSSSGVNNRLMGCLFFLAFLGCHVSFSVWMLLYSPDKDNSSYFGIKIVIKIGLVFDVISFSVLVRLLFMEVDIRAMNRETRRLEASTLELQSQIPRLAQDDDSP